MSEPVCSDPRCVDCRASLCEADEALVATDNLLSAARAENKRLMELGTLQNENAIRCTMVEEELRAENKRLREALGAWRPVVEAAVRWAGSTCPLTDSGILCEGCRPLYEAVRGLEGKDREAKGVKG